MYVYMYSMYMCVYVCINEQLGVRITQKHSLVVIGFQVPTGESMCLIETSVCLSPSVLPLFHLLFHHSCPLLHTSSPLFLCSCLLFFSVILTLTLCLSVPVGLSPSLCRFFFFHHSSVFLLRWVLMAAILSPSLFYPPQAFLQHIFFIFCFLTWLESANTSWLKRGVHINANTFFFLFKAATMMLLLSGHFLVSQWMTPYTLTTTFATRKSFNNIMKHDV